MKDSEQIYFASKDLDEERRAWVIPLTFGRARIITGPIDQGWLDDGW